MRNQTRTSLAQFRDYLAVKDSSGFKPYFHVARLAALIVLLAGCAGSQPGGGSAASDPVTGTTALAEASEPDDSTAADIGGLEGASSTTTPLAVSLDIVGLDGEPTNFPADAALSLICVPADGDVELLVVYGDRAMTTFIQDAIMEPEVEPVVPERLTPYWSLELEVDPLASDRKMALSSPDLFVLDDQAELSLGFDELGASFFEGSVTGSPCEDVEGKSLEAGAVTIELKTELYSEVQRSDDRTGSAEIRITI